MQIDLLNLISWNVHKGHIIATFRGKLGNRMLIYNYSQLSVDCLLL